MSAVSCSLTGFCKVTAKGAARPGTGESSVCAAAPVCFSRVYRSFCLCCRMRQLFSWYIYVNRPPSFLFQIDFRKHYRFRKRPLIRNFFYLLGNIRTLPQRESCTTDHGEGVLWIKNRVLWRLSYHPVMTGCETEPVRSCLQAGMAWPCSLKPHINVDDYAA